MDSLSLIPFDEISPNKSLRLAYINGQQYVSIRDVIMHICRKNTNDSAEVWRNISLDKKEELSKQLAVYQFPGRGQQFQPVITLSGSVKLVMLLPGKRAQLYRTKFADIISRYLDGDQTLSVKIEENHLIGKKRSYARVAQDFERLVQSDEANEIPQVQYIYATKSPAFPGLIKIGRTINMRERLSSLNTACAPAPHSVITMAATLDMHRDEYLTHQYFAEFRKEGEFFQVTEEDVKAYFSNVIMPRFQEELLQQAQARR